LPDRWLFKKVEFPDEDLGIFDKACELDSQDAASEWTNNPNVAKVGGLQSQGAGGEAVVLATAIPWQHRIWSPPAFPWVKKWH